MNGRRLSTGAVLAALMLLQLALHARYLQLPPSGFHVWRQTQVLSVARNYAEESMNFLEPRVDSRGPWTGITGLEFPLPYYLMALGYRAFGFHHVIARLVMLLFSFVAILGAFRLGRAVFGSAGAGLWLGLMLVLDPLFGYYSFVASPDVPMLGALMLGFASLVEASRSPRGRGVAGGLAGLALAGLLKLSSAALWPAAGVLLLRAARGDRARPWRIALLAAIGLVPVLAWYAWARHQSITYHNHDFMLESKLPYPIGIVPGIARKVLLQWLPEVYVSYPQFVLALVGGWSLLPWNAALSAATVLGFLAYAVGVMPMLDMHDYFMTPVVVPLLLLVVAGIRALAARAPASAPARVALVALVAASLVVGPWRALSRFEGAHPKESLRALEPRLSGRIEPRERVVVVGDPSPSIVLYYLHRKGWSVGDSLPADSLRALARQGARWVLSDERSFEEQPGIRPQLVAVDSVGEFRLFRLVPAGS